ncbi:hypothetical protein ACHQM5_013604 [Ranunculus cassubicifolius]
MASRQQLKSEEQRGTNKGEAAEKTLEHQEHFAEGRSHGVEIKTEQVGCKGYPGTRGAHGVSPSPVQQGIDVDESTG